MSQKSVLLWQTIRIDLFHLKRNNYLWIIIHLYPKVAFLYDLLASQLTLHIKVIFARAQCTHSKGYWHGSMIL